MHPHNASVAPWLNMLTAALVMGSAQLVQLQARRPARKGHSLFSLAVSTAHVAVSVFGWGAMLALAQVHFVLACLPGTGTASASMLAHALWPGVLAQARSLMTASVGQS